MAYIDDEQSLIDSNPIELHLFVAGGSYWAQNSSTIESISFGGKLYEPYGLKRSKKRLTTNSLKNKMTVTTSFLNPFVTPYIQAPREFVVEYFLYRGQNGDYVPHFQGFVEDVNFKTNRVEIIVSPMGSRLKRNGLMRRYQRLCPLALYSIKCGASPSTYKVSGTVDSVSGVTITSTTFGTKSDGYFDGGWVDTNGYTRMIASHIGNNVIVNSPVPGLIASTAFDAYRGCPHDITSCNTIFGRLLDYGGQPHIPNKNPFVGDAIL